MCAAPQGLVPETVTESAAPTATDGAAAWTPVTVPAEATPPDINEQNRRADVHFMTDTGARPRPEYGPGCGSGLLGRAPRLAFHLLLRAEDAAPVLVLRDGHAAFHADPDARFRFGLLREELLEKSHMS
jgi:hypothetical protein